jgi:hypothetical protein
MKSKIAILSLLIIGCNNTTYEQSCCTLRAYIAADEVPGAPLGASQCWIDVSNCTPDGGTAIIGAACR